MKGEYHAQRLGQLREMMAYRGLDAFVTLVSPGQNWEGTYYLSNFRGTSGACVVTLKDVLLVTDPRYLKQAREQTSLPIHLQEGEFFEVLHEVLLAFGVTRVGFEGNALSYASYRKMSDMPFWWEDAGELLMLLRRSKDEGEVEHIRRAGEISRRAFLASLEQVHPSMTERQYAALLEFLLRTEGGEGGAFDPVIASGPRSAMPHARAGERVLRQGDWMLVDFGARCNGYVADLSRVISFGPPDPWLREMHGILCKARRSALDVLEEGESCAAVDRAARDVIESCGLGKAFVHGLGHGLGLHVHEDPRISWKSRHTFARGDVFTLEPGIYVEGRGGIRIEDDLYLGPRGVEVLSRDFDRDIFVV